MVPAPVYARTNYRGADKLLGKVALITGGDSGIGRAVSIAYAKEGAEIAILYREEDRDAKETKQLIEETGRRCVILPGDVGSPAVCDKFVRESLKTFGRIDILVNNAAEQHPRPQLDQISPAQLERTFQTNIFGIFYLTQSCLPHLKKTKGCIINTASIVAYRGSQALLDYSATKGAVVAFTRSLSTQLAADGIRVNGVAPGPIWTPLIPSTFPDEKVENFGKDTPMGRAGEPWECAGAYVFLASEDATYITGQMIHINGGSIINT